MSACLALLLVALSGAAAPVPTPGGSAFDVRSYGARGDGVADDSHAIQAALDAARLAGGGVVHVPPGTYLVAPPGAPQPGKPNLRSLTIGSNVWLRGDGPASILKVKGGVGSYRSLFSSHPAPSSKVENVVLSDLRIDQNCRESGGAVQGGSDDTLFAIFLAWSGKNIRIERVRFDSVCGVQTVSINGPNVDEVVVRNSYFRFVKGPTRDRSGFYDNSAVYLHGQGALVANNVFESTAADGARGAIELHGSRGIASSNHTRWYESCVRLAGTSAPAERAPSRQNAFTVTGNVCSRTKDAINVWSITGHDVRGITITGNAIELAEVDHLAEGPPFQHFSGISFVWDAVSPHLTGAIEDVVIQGNTITGQRSDHLSPEAASNSGGIVLTSAGSISNVVVRGNVIRDIPTIGIHLQAMGRNAAARDVRIEGNEIVDAGHDRSAGLHRSGITVGGVLHDVVVAHNSILATTIPFQGRFAIQALPMAGSTRVAVHDNAWSAVDPKGAYQVVTADAAVEPGSGGRTARTKASPRAGDVVSPDPAAGPTRIWDLTILSGNSFTLQVPPAAATGQRLTIIIRNGEVIPLGRIRWERFVMSPWTSPAPAHHRVLEVFWDGTAWSELFQSPSDIPD